jgi:hypothetical protein
MEKRTFNRLTVLGGVIFIVGLVLTTLAGYAIWRDFTSAGIHTFTSTGEVSAREEREKTGRRSSKIYTRYYGAYVSEDGRYRTEERLSPALKSGIQQGKKYIIKREVFTDRMGAYKVVMPQSKEQHDKRGWTNVIVFGSISLVGGVLAYFSWRAGRRRVASVH